MAEWPALHIGSSPWLFLPLQLRPLAIVPHLEQLSTGCCSNEPRMDQASEANTWDVPRFAIHTFDVPACLRSLGIMVCQEATAIVLVKGTCEAPLVALKRTQVRQFDLQKVPWLTTIH